MELNLSKSKVSDFSSLDTTSSVESATMESPSSVQETKYTNPEADKQFSAFWNVEEYQNVVFMKAIWTSGKGWTAEEPTKSILERISGNGKDTISEIILNLDIMSMVHGDAFAHITRGENADKTLINLKVLNPATMAVIYNDEGIILRYEQMNRNDPKKVFKTFQPNEIFHLQHLRIGDQIHGTSLYQRVKKIIEADEKSFKILDKVMRHQAAPFIIWNLKTDDEGKINVFANKIRSVREKYEDLFVVNDESIATHEVVEISANNIILQWRDELRNKFYRAVGLPQIVPGGGGASTDSDARVIYLAFEQLVKQRQLFIEEQFWKQLGIKIKLTPPTTMMELIGNDENKDAAAPFAAQAGQLAAGGSQQ